MLWLRPTSVQKYETCGEQYRLSEIQRLRPRLTGSALVFGTTIHKACLGWLHAHAQGLSAIEPQTAFETLWEEALATTSIRYSSTHGEADLREIGKRLCKQFPEAWSALKLFPVMSDRGLLIENRLRVAIEPTVGLSGEPDIVAMDARGNVVVVDLKTPASAAFEGFTDIAEQLTAYQILVDAHREAFGLPRVGKHLFLEGLKKKDAQWHVQWGDRHSDAQEGDYLRKLKMVAKLIRQGYFPHRSASAFNSPCELCDLYQACRKGQIAEFIEQRERAA